jgi:hypothetical protein
MHEAKKAAPDFLSRVSPVPLAESMETALYKIH